MFCAQICDKLSPAVPYCDRQPWLQAPGRSSARHQHTVVLLVNLTQPRSQKPLFNDMITYVEFWIFSICLLGAVQCFLLAGYFLLLGKGYRQAHRLFAALMLLIGVRLVKSGHYLFAGETLPDWWMNLGFSPLKVPHHFISCPFIRQATVRSPHIIFHMVYFRCCGNRTGDGRVTNDEL